ncbi:primosomal protein N' (replication factor Y) [Chitinivorax tropicus]|uniref:Replication restart protein PriA n=1 Tax=Chitinivorax tropicus TaxID=714531 RepID=A0A840MR27_9PROT|nr:primosomal protein N' [Chitinivorax tropicus]MBB5018896.1 primosomal protein N' (replication factor Y) [Chitinivorax tropicus]
MTIARIALDVPLAGPFDYLAPQLTQEDVGRRVVVPFGPRKMVGIVLDITPHSDYDPAKLKPIKLVHADMPPLAADVLATCQFCSDYYHHPLGQVIFTGLPGRLRQIEAFTRPAGSHWCLTEQGAHALPSAITPRARAQAKLLVALQANPLGADQAQHISANAPAILRKWAANGWVQRMTPARSPYPHAPASPSLTDEQRAAIDLAQSHAGFQVMLLHGVTGSGKTEVYLQLIAKALAQSRQALILVPEINLTPQLTLRFSERFPERRIVSLHSGLADGERADNWLAAQSGEADIILGTRLAVFTPIPRLGLIVVDEEHDGSFKQQEGLRYSARDVAIYRAHVRDVPIILGSATPSLETYHNAQTGRYRYAKLSRRAVQSARLPTIQTIDTSRLLLQDGLSDPLVNALHARLQAGEQSLVFINRRGYSPVLFCGECGWIAGCKRCSARLVVHLRARQLRCHLCGHEEPIVSACPDCGNQDIRPLGVGTQRIEAALADRLPEARIIRVDRDVTRRKEAFTDILSDIHQGKADILIGTQMLAKGHDFPNLSLVCVLNADSGLYSADFRATEKLFALLLQVSGRAGRAEIPGEVLIQTQFPNHPLLHALITHDFDSYARRLLTERQQAQFPPFVYQAILRAEAPDIDQAIAFLDRAKALAEQLDSPVTLFDPVPSPLSRLAGLERAQLLVQHPSRNILQTLLKHWLPHLHALSDRQIRWIIDIDPQDL